MLDNTRDLTVWLLCDAGGSSHVPLQKRSTSAVTPFDKSIPAPSAPAPTPATPVELKDASKGSDQLPTPAAVGSVSRSQHSADGSITLRFVATCLAGTFVCWTVCAICLGAAILHGRLCQQPPSLMLYGSSLL